METWGLIRETFVDPTFNHQGIYSYNGCLISIELVWMILHLIHFVEVSIWRADWDSKLQQTMAEMFPLRSADAAYNKIGAMLSTLGDPFTRIISPKVDPHYNFSLYLLTSCTL